jgi:5'-nucleotidase
MNPGGLRADMKYAASGNGEADGEVTYQEAAAVQPFANTLVIEDLTGEQIRQTLEQQWQPTGAGRPFLKLGVSKGFDYTYDPEAERGSRITAMTLDGEPIVLTETYKVTVNSFLASGGDNFTALNGAAKKADSGQVDLQAQVDYFTEHQDVAVDADQRAVGVTITPTPEGGFQPGDAIDVKLSSLTFSNAADQEGDVSISAGDEVLATSKIDTTIVDTTDEQGRAELSFVVPGAESTPAVTASPAAALADRGAVRLAAAVTPAATTDEPLVVTLPNGQTITLAVSVPVAAAPGDPGTGDPGTGTPGAGDPVDGGTGPGSGTAPGLDDEGGSGDDPIADGTTRDGALAFTGGTIAAPAIIAGLLLLAGIATVLVRRYRARHAATGTDVVS